jgi:hypothetical protein
MLRLSLLATADAPCDRPLTAEIRTFENCDRKLRPGRRATPAENSEFLVSGGNLSAKRPEFRGFFGETGHCHIGALGGRGERIRTRTVSRWIAPSQPGKGNARSERAGEGTFKTVKRCLQPANMPGRRGFRRPAGRRAWQRSTGRRSQDRDRVAGGQEYEVEYFARKHGITAEQARQLMKEHGNSREVLDREAEKLKRKAG